MQESKARLFCQYVTKYGRYCNCIRFTRTLETNLLWNVEVICNSVLISSSIDFSFLLFALYLPNIFQVINSSENDRPSFFRGLFYLTASVSLHRKTCLTLRRLMSYIYGAPSLDVSRSHTTTQHSR